MDSSNITNVDGSNINKVDLNIVEDKVGPLNIGDDVINYGLEINKIFYILGVLILLFINFGPYFYYKYYKKKSFANNTTISVKHTV